MIKKSALIPLVPPEAPSRNSRFGRWLGRLLLRMLGWRVIGEFPREPKLVVALAPHTSNWDFVVAMAGLLACDIKAEYLMKKEVFIWPLSKLFVWLGGFPLDRSVPEGAVEQLAAHCRANDRFWVGITPEGTRKKVSHWKTGYLRLAEQADVPVCLIAWDYREKALMIDRVWPTTGDHEADAAAMRDYARNRYQARHPELS